MTLSELYSKADFKNKYGMIFNDDCMNLLSNINIAFIRKNVYNDKHNKTN